MLIKDLELDSTEEKVEFLKENLENNLGLGIFVVPKEDIIFSSINNENPIENCYDAIKDFDENDITYISSYESDNFYILKNKTYPFISSNLGYKIEDARDFQYNTVAIDLSSIDCINKVLIFKLDH